MRLKRFNQINEGLRINNKILNRNEYGREFPIDEIIRDLSNLENLLSLYVDDDLIELKSELEDAILELNRWKNDGWTHMKFYEYEWIPLKN